jgi:hypothetical protein
MAILIPLFHFTVEGSLKRRTSIFQFKTWPIEILALAIQKKPQTQLRNDISGVAPTELSRN